MTDQRDIKHDNELRKILEERDAMWANELNELQEQQKQISARIAELQEVRRSFAPALTIVGIHRTPFYPLHSTSDGSPATTHGIRLFGNAGNKNPNMPERREQYMSVSLAKAVRTVLDGGGTIHTTDIIRSIFVIEDEKQIQIARRSLNSTLAHGVEEGLWERPSPGYYRNPQTPLRSLEHVEQPQLGFVPTSDGVSSNHA